jgi:cyclopropane fatty-acyl-phospholipid synthase-like methyltransferase
MGLENGQERLSEWYDDAYFQNYPRHNRRIAQIIRRIPFKRDDSVCELGCGLGHILIAISNRIATGVGIDFSEYAVKEAGNLAKAQGGGNLTFLALKIEDLVGRPDFKGRFDKVLMLDISEHLYDDTLLQFFRTTAHILKPHGELYLHTPNSDYLIERMKKKNFILQQFPSHIAVRNLKEYEKLLKQAGFDLLSHEFLPHYHPLLRCIDNILRKIPILNSQFQARILLRAAPR